VFGVVGVQTAHREQGAESSIGAYHLRVFWHGDRFLQGSFQKAVHADISCNPAGKNNRLYSVGSLLWQVEKPPGFGKDRTHIIDLNIFAV
jgi:hypothetical protein